VLRQRREQLARGWMKVVACRERVGAGRACLWDYSCRGVDAEVGDEADGGFHKSTVAQRSLNDLPDCVELSAQLAVLAFKGGHAIVGCGDVALEDRNATPVENPSKNPVTVKVSGTRLASDSTSASKRSVSDTLR
jgi:hypothetical protein